MCCVHVCIQYYPAPYFGEGAFSQMEGFLPMEYRFLASPLALHPEMLFLLVSCLPGSAFEGSFGLPWEAKARKSCSVNKNPSTYRNAQFDLSPCLKQHV